VGTKSTPFVSPNGGNPRRGSGIGALLPSLVVHVLNTQHVPSYSEKAPRNLLLNPETEALLNQPNGWCLEEGERVVDRECEIPN
jgi:hypothetical protein